LMYISHRKGFAMSILSEFIVLSCQPEGGAYHFTLTSDGEIIEGRKITIPSPMWGEIQNGRLCTVFLGDPDAPEQSQISREEGYAEYSLVSGNLIGSVFPTRGTVVCHFCRNRGEIYAANYSDGTICRITKTGSHVIGHTPTDDIPLGSDSRRQERPHVHQCILSPDGKYVLVCDLGLDCVFVYDREMNEVSYAKVPSGHGARHAVFSPDGGTVYVIGEMAASVSEFSWHDGLLRYAGTVSMRRGDDAAFPAEGGAAITMSADGHHLYATDRGCDTIVHFKRSELGLELVSLTPSGGRHPRDFKLIADGHIGICCNQFGNSFAVFTVGSDGELKLYKTVSLPSPLCVCEI